VFHLEAKRGQLLRVALSTRPAGSLIIFADLALVQEDRTNKIVASADSVTLSFSYKVKKTGSYLLRLQPELLKGGEYTLTITAGPSLKFPVAISGKPRTESFWGDSRDNGGRRHEGIDIFAPKGTPALAAFKGTVTSVTESNLGGKVVFMRPEGEDYTLYYAHLGVQLVHNGQEVLAGDTVGLIDNTGNAKYTPSHLHFGIYTSEGAVDPLPFVDCRSEEAPAIALPLSRLNDTLRLNRNSAPFNTGEPVFVHAISANRYKVSGVLAGKHGLTQQGLAPLKMIHAK
jgi:murein DD-endopeptidase MepM/ murein hydrolase activator NlpD